MYRINAINTLRQILKPSSEEKSPKSHDHKAQTLPQSPDSLDFELEKQSQSSWPRQKKDVSLDVGNGEDSSDPIVSSPDSLAPDQRRSLTPDRDGNADVKRVSNLTAPIKSWNATPARSSALSADEERRLLGESNGPSENAVRIIVPREKSQPSMRVKNGLRPLNTMNNGSSRRPNPIHSQPKAAFQSFTSNSAFDRAHQSSYIGHPYEPKEYDLETGRPHKKLKTQTADHIDLIDDSTESTDESKSNQHTPQAVASIGRFRSGNGKPRHVSKPMVPEYAGVNDLVEIPKGVRSKLNYDVSHSNKQIPLDHSDDELTRVEQPHNAQDSQKHLPKLPERITNADSHGATSKYFPAHVKGLSDQFVATNGTKRNVSIGNDSSPDILHGSETTVRKNRIKAARPQVTNTKTEQSFPLRSIICGEFPQDYSELQAVVNFKSQELSIVGSTLLADGPFFIFSLRKAIRGFYEPGQTILLLEFSKEGQNPNKIFMDVESEKTANDILKIVADRSGFNLRYKEEKNWMRRAWQKQLEELGHHANSIERASAPAKAERMQFVEVPKIPADQMKRPSRTIVSSMRGSELPSSSPTPAPRRVASQRLSLHNNIGKDQEIADLNLLDTPLIGNKAPMKAHATRSGGHKATTLLDDDDEEAHTLRSIQKVDLGPPWRKPLVYPQSGKNRAEVEFQDLERLQDHEMLNDNLIGFYLRYLQSYLEQYRPDLAENIYFFNTYFFATLTASGRGRRGINYEGVQKWTRRGVDIFTKKFIVVPINEAAHWYVALICNLPALKREMSLEDDKHGNEAEEKGNTTITLKQEEQTDATVPSPGQHEELPEMMEIDQQNESNRLAVDEMSLDSPGPATKTPTHENPLNAKATSFSTSNRAGSANKKKLGRNLQRYDPDEPIIITLDSLAMGRSPTVRMLREYVVAEASEKRAMAVDGSSIKGMSAKGIPFQSNFSDCGLFLLAYVEKFVLDPYRFVHDILQREMNVDDHWPEMESTDLRHRLRSFIVNLRKTQQNSADCSILPSVGKILLGPPRPPPSRPMADAEPKTRPEKDTEQVKLLPRQRDARAPTPPKKPRMENAQHSPPLGEPSPRDERTDQPVKTTKRNLQAGKTHQGLIVLDEESPTEPAQKATDKTSINFLTQLEDAAQDTGDTVVLKSPDRASRASRASSINTEFMVNNKNNEPEYAYEKVTSKPILDQIEEEIRVEQKPRGNPVIEDSIVVDTQSLARNRQEQSTNTSGILETHAEQEIPETPVDDGFEDADEILNQGAQNVEPVPLDLNENVEGEGGDENEMLDV